MTMGLSANIKAYPETGWSEASSEILIGKQFAWQTVLVLRVTDKTFPKTKHYIWVCNPGKRDHRCYTHLLNSSKKLDRKLYEDVPSLTKCRRFFRAL